MRMPEKVPEIRLIGLNSKVFNGKRNLSESDLKNYFVSMLEKKFFKFNVPNDKPLRKTPANSLIIFSYKNKPVASGIYKGTGKNKDNEYPFYYKLDNDSVLFIPEQLRDSIKSIWPNRAWPSAVKLDSSKYSNYLEIIDKESSLIEEDLNDKEWGDEKENEKYISNNIIYRRDPKIKEMAMKRSMGKCELCNKKAPFIDKDGNPFLESHHIEYLSAGGKDILNNVVVLCPNCHRRIHIIQDATDIQKLKDVAGKK